MGLTKITSRILDSSGVTTVGTISTGVWQGTAINQTYLVGQSGTNTGDETLARINALNITELGTISSGVWQGSVIAEAYLQNQSGTNTGDQTTISGNAGTVTNGVYTVGNQTIAGVKTFSSAATFQLSALTNPSGVDLNTVLTIKNNGWSGITMLSSAATGSFLTFGDADAGFRGRILYLHGSTDAMVFETAASEKLRISSDGNVGIGTTSPSAKLQIHTTTSAGTAEVAAFLVNNSTTINTEVRLAFAAHTNNDISTDRYSYISAKNSSGSNGQDLVFATNAAGASATPKLTISSGGTATFSGSVTIPFLNVSGSGSQIGAFNGTGANGGYLSWQTSGTTIADLGTAQQIFGSGGNDTFGINARGARSLILGTNNSARLTISSGGDTSLATGNSLFVQGAGRVYTHNVTLREQDNTAKFQIYSSGGGCVFYNSESNGAYYFYTNGSERMRITSAGAIGQAVTPISDPYVAGAEQWMTYQIGKGGIIGAYKNNNESMFGFNTYVSAPSGLDKAVISGINGTAIRCYADQITFNHLTSSGTSQTQSTKLTISNNGNVFVTNGNLIAGSTSDVTGTHYFQKAVSVNGGILYAGSNTTGRFSLVVQASDSGYNNSPATCLKVGATSSTSRSVSAAGTFNASGADYAEYMIKSTTDPINKGDILGVNSDGLLTNIFNDAISFVIKSTDPSFVGNDTWGIESEDKDEIEEARIKVDRVAFSGQVPCNVTGASVGDYIIPVASSDGKITGEAVTNPTFEQYKISVGKVWKIMENGNSWVAVKIG